MLVDDGDGAEATGLRDDMRFLLVEACVEDIVRDAFGVEKLADSNSDFSMLTVPTRTGCPGKRLFADRLGDGAEFVLRVLVELVFLVDALDGHVGRDRHDVHLVDVVEFRRLGRRGTGHAAESSDTCGNSSGK